MDPQILRARFIEVLMDYEFDEETAGDIADQLVSTSVKTELDEALYEDEEDEDELDQS